MSPGETRVLGESEGLNGDHSAQVWTPPTQTEVEKLPPLPASAARGWDVQDREAEVDISLPGDIAPDSTHAYVYQNPRAAAAVVRTILRRDEGGGHDGPLAGLSAPQVAAAFLCGLGREVGSRVMRHLHANELVPVVKSMTVEADVTHEVAMRVLEIVRQRMESGDYLEDGGKAFTIKMLEGAMPGWRARGLLDRALSIQENGFEMLNRLPPEQTAPFVSHEHPMTIALILSQLSASQAAGIMRRLPPRLQADVSYRIAITEKVSPQSIENIADALCHSLRERLAGDCEVGGLKVLADILNRTGSSVEKNVLDQMDAQDPQMAEAVRQHMFTFDDIVKMSDRELQVILKEVDEKDIVVALKAASEELKAKVMGNLSERVRTFVTEELERLGPMKLSEAEEVQLRIVHKVRQLEEEGKVVIVRGESATVWV